MMIGAIIPVMASFLVIGPHPDDQELGMGGTIARLVSQGHRVHLIDMTNGEPTPHGSIETAQKNPPPPRKCWVSSARFWV